MLPLLTLSHSVRRFALCRWLRWFAWNDCEATILVDLDAPYVETGVENRARSACDVGFFEGRWTSHQSLRFGAIL
jgi:hypothetical protein